MSTIAATRSKTYDIVYIAVFAVIMAICSWISIPTAVPFTLQTFGVFVAVGVLGGKRGTLSILVFILLGAIGVPVFAGFSGGFADCVHDRRTDRMLCFWYCMVYDRLQQSEWCRWSCNCSGMVCHSIYHSGYY